MNVGALRVNQVEAGQDNCPLLALSDRIDGLFRIKRAVVSPRILLVRANQVMIR
jgi:hypothetical protein